MKGGRIAYKEQHRIGAIDLPSSPAACWWSSTKRRTEMQEQHIGRVTHYYKRIGVAVLELSGGLKVGDVVHIRGHTTDFTQPVESLEIEHQKIQSVGPGAEIALKVIERVRKGDAIYKVMEK